MKDRKWWNILNAGQTIIWYCQIGCLGKNELRAKEKSKRNYRRTADFKNLDGADLFVYFFISLNLGTA